MNNFIIFFSFFIISIIPTYAIEPQALKKKQAVEYLSACGNFIRFDEQFVFTGFGTYWTTNNPIRIPKPSLLRFVSIDHNTEYQVEALDSVIDVLKYNEYHLVLTYNGVEVWDLKKYERVGFFKTHILDRELRNEEHPKSFAVFGDKLFVAHGILGFSVVDLKSLKVIQMTKLISNQFPLLSVANDITISGRYGFLAMDSYTLTNANEKRPFNGIVVIDLVTQSVVKELNGMEPGAESLMSDDKNLFVSFYGQPVLKYSIASLLNSSIMPNPLKRVWRYPIDGKLKGKPSLDGDYIYSCFSRMPKEGEGPYFIKIPYVLNRKALMLD